jgi:murein tripeptide amidase MpaA
MPKARRSFAIDALFAGGLGSALAILAASFPLTLAAGATPAGGNLHDPYRQVRIAWSEFQAHSTDPALTGIEPMHVEKGQYVSVLAKNAELAALRAAGIPFTIEIEDLEAHYTATAPGPGFGAFHTYSETIEFLDLLHASYPSITTARRALGPTWHGNTIWAMKISDQPDLEEPDEPEVLFDGLHHASEVMNIEVLLSFMQHLCENYGVDAEVTALVDSRQVWFVPIVNPDGYLYIESTHPNGGGIWRKNRRDDQGPCIGVDNNRNYPFQWGRDDGSSSDPCGETYRGPSPGSELENQALMNLMRQHRFVTHNSYHTPAGMVLFPWGYTTAHAPDDAIFRQMAAVMARDSGNPIGQPPELLYLVSGALLDWSYGEQVEKPRAFGFTTEIGGSGLWPDPSEIPGLIAENLHSNLLLVQAAGAFPDLANFLITGGNGNERLDPGETANLVVSLRNAGVVTTAENVVVRLRSDDAYLALAVAERTFPDIGPWETRNNWPIPFVFTADPSTPTGHQAALELEITCDPDFVIRRDLILTVGQPPAIYVQDFETGAGGWEQDPSHTAATGAFVRIDPNPTEYQPGNDTTPTPGVYAWVTGQNMDLGNDDVDNGVSATRSPLIDLSGHELAQLVLMYFHGQRDPGNDLDDFFRIQLSNDGGATYPATLVAIGDVNSTPEWHEFRVALDEVLPLTAQMRIRVQASDGPATGDAVEGGIDDVAVLEPGSGNQPPGVPALLSPPDGAGDQPPSPTLLVANATDPEGDPLTYSFRVYADPLLTEIAAGVDGVPEGAQATGWNVAPPLAPGTYFWRAYAADPELRGLFMPAASFTVGGTVAVGSGDTPGRPQLARATPNPFQAATLVSYRIERPARVRLDVFDATGRHLRRLADGVAAPGLHEVAWDGRDARGAAVAAGVYLAQLWVDGRIETQKMVRVP